MLVHINYYQFDTNFLFLIQQITNEKSQDILSYFYDLGRVLAEDMVEHSKAQYAPTKSTIALYKDTKVPFKLSVQPVHYEWAERKTSGIVKCKIDVSFPRKISYIKGSEFENLVIATNLQLQDETIEPFRKPTMKRPKCMRDIDVKG